MEEVVASTLTDSQRMRLKALGNDYLSNYYRLDEVQSKILMLERDARLLKDEESKMLGIEDGIGNEIADIVGTLDETDENRAEVREILKPFLAEISAMNIL